MNAGEPLPKKGEIDRTKLPNTMEGVRFEIARISKYIVDGCKDPLVIFTAQKIAGLALGTARQLGQKVTDKNRELIILKGLHAWGHANFEHISNPPNVEIIKTPARMIRELEIPEEFARAFWDPIRESMAKGKKVGLPKPRITGSCGVSTTLILTLAAAVGFRFLQMKFGGQKECLHYLWGCVNVGDRWIDVDILMPEFGEHHKFEKVELIGIPF